jgi:hypothetical protein
MDVECLLPCSQESAVGPYPEPDESNQQHIPSYCPTIGFEGWVMDSNQGSISDIHMRWT